MSEFLRYASPNISAETTDSSFIHVTSLANVIVEECRLLGCDVMWLL
jgi:hypothetical protein